MPINRTPATLRTESVSVSYGASPVVHDASVELLPGGVTALIGPNGSGKSTLLRGICRLAHTTGRVTLDGSDSAALSPRAFAKRLTILAQQRPTPGGLTVSEVVELGRHPHRKRFSRTDQACEKAVERAIALTGLEELRHRPVAELSGGQLQRVWLATCLAQETDVLLLDEPTTFLDLKHQMSLLDLIHDLADTHGLTIGVVLHDLEQAADIADRVILVSEGRITATGTPAEVMTAERLSATFGVDIQVATLPFGGLAVRAQRSGRRLSARAEELAEPALLSA
ncbi:MULTISPECIES: ABC transporter ATP-binding protein [Nesterenkonia]|uniref:Iron complex transport system ATP-binding protein n=1 Tax=Nesterenkonia aurantiaca TaxID=1436010 RepID=A0A4R7G548_9MICC|nr:MULTISPECIES: ABC transporter ATP-binding protein [Nesterenkonia]TDS86340.1 iron complex transport system ATP-binding protein [Nesterenkonia aurantiaca]